MDRRIFLTIVLAAIAAMAVSLLVVFIVSKQTGVVSHFGLQLFVMNAVLAIALTSGFVGLEKLGRSGNRKAKSALTYLLVISWIIIFIPDLTPGRLHQILHGWNIPDWYGFIPFMSLLVAIYPLSLYLNRSQRKLIVQRDNEVKQLITTPAKEEVFSKLLFLINLSAQRKATELIATDHDRKVVLDQDVEHNAS